MAAGLYDRVSPVNCFRIVFNTYFSAQLPLLPEQTYLSPGALTGRAGSNE